MALSTVANYITQARALMQDETAPYRYSDVSIVDALNMAIGESFRLRPDMWLAYFGLALPNYSAASPSVVVDVPTAFRMAFLYFVVGLCQIRDQEDVQDQRSGALLNKFSSSLLVSQ